MNVSRAGYSVSVTGLRSGDSSADDEVRIVLSEQDFRNCETFPKLFEVADLSPACFGLSLKNKQAEPYFILYKCDGRAG